VDRAAADYASVSADLETVRTLGTALERQIALVRSRQQAGDSSRLDLLRAEIERVDHLRAALAVRQRALHALGALEDAVQRPLAWPESAWRGPTRLSDNK
jgi:outer membrane protein TolC